MVAYLRMGYPSKVSHLFKVEHLSSLSRSIPFLALWLPLPFPSFLTTHTLSLSHFFLYLFPYSRPDNTHSLFFTHLSLTLSLFSPFPLLQSNLYSLKLLIFNSLSLSCHLCLSFSPSPPLSHPHLTLSLSL